MKLLAISIIPSIIIMIIIYNLDKEKEPKKLLFLLFGLGMLSCIVTAIITSLVNFFFPFFTYDNIVNTDNYLYLLIYSFIIVGLIEEFSKWLFNISIAWNTKEFDQLYDAIVYAVFISLGFATLENVLYVMMSNFSIGIIRAIVSVPGHAFYGVSMGFYLGLSKLAYYNGNDKLSNKYMYKSIIVPALLHGIFDFLLLSGKIIFVIIFIFFIIFLYIYGIKKIRNFSKIEKKLGESDIKYCSNCGNRIQRNHCDYCGEEINN